MGRKRRLRRLTKKEWVKRIMAKNIKSHDVEVKVTGVSMEGESNINEHNRTSGEDKGKSSKEKIGNSRENGTRESN